MEVLDDFNFINKMMLLRIFNIYFLYRWFSRKYLENDGKIVYVVRNLKDVVVFMFFYFKEIGDFIGSEKLDLDDRVNGMLFDVLSKFFLV